MPDGASASAPGATGLPLRVRHIASGASFALVVPRGDELAALRSLGLTVPDADRAASRPFYCARFETTNAEYRLFRPDHHLVALPAAAHDPSCWAVTNAAFPVVRVTFAEAAEFAASRRCAIPSWLEWFAAARAFSGSEVFPSSGEEFAAASRPPNFWDASTLAFFTNLQTRPAAFPWSDGAPLLRSTAFAGDQVGVHDLVGNAAEWIDGPGRAAGRRPAAGGSWKTPRFDSEEAAANAYFGDDRDATAAHSDVGVRLVFRFDV